MAEKDLPGGVQALTKLSETQVLSKILEMNPKDSQNTKERTDEVRLALINGVIKLAKEKMATYEQTNRRILYLKDSNEPNKDAEHQRLTQENQALLARVGDPGEKEAQIDMDHVEAEY